MMVHLEPQLSELRRLTARAENRRTETGIPRVAMVRGQIPEHELAAVYEPMLNLILQGSKTLTVGAQTLRYDPATYFLLSVDLPAMGTVHDGGPGQPYLSVALTLDPEILAALVTDAPEPRGVGSGFAVASVTPELLDAWVRMLRLMESPADIPVLAPGCEREILYRVLQGPQGHILREIALPKSALSRVQTTLVWLRENFALPLRIEELASRATMSESAFHRHFKAATGMSPLQFQKQIRLLRARSLLIANTENVASVAFSVGYESASQFSREYARMFGKPPATDAAQVQQRLRHRSLGRP
jgi:AraC-like DNA-binding protein